MLTRRQSWVLALIESRVHPVLQNYFERPLNETLVVSRKQVHELVKSHEFLHWYFAPDEIELWRITQPAGWNRYVWKTRYSFVRKGRRLMQDTNEETYN